MPIYVSYDIVPPLGSPEEPTTSEDGGVPRAVTRLQRAYGDRVRRFQSEFAAGTVNDARRGDRTESAYVVITLLLDEEEQTLTIDEELYRSLFDLYVAYGWAGIKAAQKALTGVLAGTARDLATWRFFLFTRNMLALLVRETLIGLEAHAGMAVFQRLGQAQRQLSAALNGPLAMAYTPAHVATDDFLAPANVPDRYALKNKALADELLSRLKAAAEAREHHEEKLRTLSQVESRRRAAEVAAANESAPGSRSPSSGDDRAAERVKRLDAEMARANGDVARALDKLDEALRAVFAKAPLALLIAPGVRPTVSAAVMQDALGRTLYGLTRNLDAIATATRPDQSQLARLMPGLPAEWLNDASGQKPLDDALVERVFGFDLDLNRDLVKAIANDDGPAMSWLGAQAAWTQLLANGVVEPGTFEQVVIFHWTEALIAFAREVAERRSAVTHTLMIAGAVLSLAELANPPLGVVTAVVAVAGIAYTASTVSEQFEQLDQAIAKQLPGLGDPGQTALAALGELLAQRPRILADVAGEVLLQLLAIASGVRWPQVLEALRWKGYFDDVVTLVQACDRS